MGEASRGGVFSVEIERVLVQQVDRSTPKNSFNVCLTSVFSSLNRYFVSPSLFANE